MHIGKLSILFLLSCAAAYADMAPPAYYAQLQNVVNAENTSKDEKIQTIRKVLGDAKEPTSVLIAWIRRVDEPAAREAALQIFREETASRADRLAAGRVLLTGLGDEAFPAEYAPLLVAFVLNGGEDEFMHPRTSLEPSAVGEYAFIASDFEGMSSKHFPLIADKRVIPVLVKCLDAPDHVYPAQSGCCDNGPPGTSTGRNTQRQQIPVALSKLDATDAIGAMSRILTTHKNYWERFHSAAAIGTLGKPEDIATIERFLLDHPDENDNRLILLGLGTGLIARGDGRGVKYMAFKYSTYFGKDDVFSVLYMLEERLKALDGFNDASALRFYREALEYAPLRNLLLFDPAKVTVPKDLMRVTADGKRTERVTTPEGVLDYARERILTDVRRMTDAIVAAKMVELTPQLEQIGQTSKDTRVRDLASAAAEKLKRPEAATESMHP